VRALLTGYRQVLARVGLLGVSNHEDVRVFRHRATLEARRAQHNSDPIDSTTKSIGKASRCFGMVTIVILDIADYAIVIGQL
jgi:hypothetical protein